MNSHVPAASLAKVINSTAAHTIEDSTANTITANIIEDSIANITGDSTANTITAKVIETPTIPISAPIVSTEAKPPKRIILVHEVIPKVSIYVIFNEKTFNRLY